MSPSEEDPNGNAGETAALGAIIAAILIASCAAKKRHLRNQKHKQRKNLFLLFKQLINHLYKNISMLILVNQWNK